MKQEDFEGFPCGCPECQQAGVNELPQIRDYHSGKWLHGYDLKRWYDARARFQQMAEQIKPKGMR